jgi:hypothetical protein
MKIQSLALAGLLAAALSAPPARADLRYTTETKLGAAASTGNAEQDAAAAKMMPTLRTTTFYKNMNERQETRMNMMGMYEANEVTLTLCDQQQTYSMDPALKIYTVAPIGGGTFQPPSQAPGKPAKTEKTGEGKLITTFSVQDLGTEKLQNLDTRHSLVTVRTQTSGCLGAADATVKFEVWVAPKQITPCPARYAPSRVVAGPNGCSITYEVKGDTKGMEKAMGGMVVQQKFYIDDKASMTQELRDYSEAALDAALFTVPADYKKVTQAEYDKAKAEAMRKAMMGGLKTGLPGAGQDTAQGDKKSGADKAAGAVADEVNDAVNDATNDAANDTKNQAREELRKKIRLPKIKF